MMDDVEFEKLKSATAWLSSARFMKIELPDGSLGARYCGAEEQKTHVITEDRINLLKDVTPKLSSKVLAVEAKLTATKWFDYSFMNPVTATETFAAEYQRLYRRTWAAYTERKEAEKK